MRLRRFFVLFAMIFVSTSITSAQEIRGFWADGFAEGFKTPAQVDQLLARLRKANCNAIFAQMRKSADSYYQSRYDVWASDNPRRFDALAYLIEKAHSGTPRIQVHAWLNTFAVGKDRGNPLHITLAHPEWLSISDIGETHDGEAAKLDPGHPDAADYTARVYLDVLRNYDVDGIHFDFVRYGGPRWGYNPVSVARFNARHGRTGQPKPNDPQWKQWRRDQVTALVRKVYVLAAAIKPKAQVSAATVTWQNGPRNLAEWNQKSAAMNRVFQDWRSWMKEGIIDLNCLMSYYDEKKHPDWYRRWLEWAKDNQFGRQLAPANGSWLNLIPDSLAQISAIRKPSDKGFRSKGVMLYSYAGTNRGPDGTEHRFNEEFYSTLSKPSRFSGNPPFAKPAAYPRMPWKENPKTGHLYGFVLNPNDLSPVDGAKVTVKSQNMKRETRTDGTGFWGVVSLPRGDYSVESDALGRTTRTSVDESLRAGESNCVNLFPGLADSALSDQYDELEEIGENKPVFFSHQVVLGGSDSFPGELYVASSSHRGATRVRLASSPNLQIQPGDVVAMIGTLGSDEGEWVIHASNVRVVNYESPESGYLRVLSLPDERVKSPRPANFPVTVRGKVAESSSGRIFLDGSSIDVTLGARKAPGIEDSIELLDAPRVGSEVEITGILTTSYSGDTAVIRIRPRTASDIRILSLPPGEFPLIPVLLAASGIVAGVLLIAVNRKRVRSGTATVVSRND